MLTPQFLKSLHDLPSTELEAYLKGQLSIMNEARAQVDVLVAEKEKRIAEGKWIVYEERLQEILGYSPFRGGRSRGERK